MEPRLKSYLRTNRLRTGLTQAELASLFCLESGSFVSRIERLERQPTLPIALACQVLFDVAPRELFPGIFAEIKDVTLQRADELYESLQGSGTNATNTKLDFLEDVAERGRAGQHLDV